MLFFLTASIPIKSFSVEQNLQAGFYDDEKNDAKILTEKKMSQLTAGAAPLVYAGGMVASRFIATRTVSKKAAQGIVRKGGSVMAKNRQQASAVERGAGSKKPIREFHPGSGARYTHAHPNPRNGGHVWYGKPRTR